MTTNNNAKLAEISHIFRCEICDYNTTRNYNLNIHLNSIKHKNRLLTTENNDSLVEISKKYICPNCTKEFSDRAGLWRHKNKCNHEICEFNECKNESEKLIKYLMNENLEFKQLIIEQNKQMIELSKNSGSHNTTHTNSHNKIFNLQVFLNETCKDAMNMSDFLNQLQLTTKDLEITGQDGFAVGIGHSFVQGIKALEVHKRPLHCSDLKRETFYIKEDNIWEKEDGTRGKLTKAIQKIAHKNILNIPAWKAEHPYCRDQHHKDNDKFLQIMIESMTGKDDPNIIQEYDKIIRNVAKEVFIDKS